MSILFKNVERDYLLQEILEQENQNNKKAQDRKTYSLEMKLNSSIQTLFLNPLGNFEMSLCIPGFNNSNFMVLKDKDEDDFTLSE